MKTKPKSRRGPQVRTGTSGGKAQTQPKVSSSVEQPHPSRALSIFLSAHVWPIVGIGAALLGALLAYFAYRLQSESEDKKTAHISYVALPVAERQSQPNLHRIHLTLSNEGPAIASLFIATYFCPSQFHPSNCKPIVLREPAGGSVEVKPMSTPGHFQLVVKSLAPGDGAHVAIGLAGNEDPMKQYLAFLSNRSEGREFARKYVGTLTIHGENIATVNRGTIDGLLQ